MLLMQIMHTHKDFERRDLGEYHDLQVQSNTFLLADVFKNFRNIFINICELDPAKSFFQLQDQNGKQ